MQDFIKAGKKLSFFLLQTIKKQKPQAYKKSIRQEMNDLVAIFWRITYVRHGH